MIRTLLIVSAIAVLAVVALRPARPAAPIAVETAAPQHRGPTVPRGEDAVVYVAGAVARPGLYRLRAGMRVDDAVRRAGGLRPDADAAGINLAERLKDGEEVVAPVLGAPTRYPSRRRTATRTTRADKKEPAAIVNVNTATAADLATIPGIGKTLAARIVEVRGRDGAFATLDELLDVAGMTPARLDRASQYLEI